MLLAGSQDRGQTRVVGWSISPSLHYDYYTILTQGVDQLDKGKGIDLIDGVAIVKMVSAAWRVTHSSLINYMASDAFVRVRGTCAAALGHRRGAAQALDGRRDERWSRREQVDQTSINSRTTAGKPLLDLINLEKVPAHHTRFSRRLGGHHSYVGQQRLPPRRLGVTLPEGWPHDRWS